MSNGQSGYNFEINQRGIMGLLGSNGAGKSTTMNIICGVLKQTEGNVFIDGIDLRENPVEAKKNVGFLPQKASPAFGLHGRRVSDVLCRSSHGG